MIGLKLGFDLVKNKVWASYPVRRVGFEPA